MSVALTFALLAGRRHGHVHHLLPARGVGNSPGAGRGRHHRCSLRGERCRRTRHAVERRVPDGLGTSTVLVLLVGFLVLREPFSWIKLVAIGLIAAGIYLLQREGL